MVFGDLGHRYGDIVTLEFSDLKQLDGVFYEFKGEPIRATSRLVFLLNELGEQNNATLLHIVYIGQSPAFVFKLN